MIQYSCLAVGSGFPVILGFSGPLLYATLRYYYDVVNLRE